MAVGSVTSMLMNPINRLSSRLGQAVEQGVINKIPVVGTVYHQAKGEVSEFAGVGAYSNAVPLGGLSNQQNSIDPILNTVGTMVDRSANDLNALQRELMAQGNNPSPATLAKIQIATAMLNTWQSAMTNLIEARNKAPQEIARNLRG